LFSGATQKVHAQYDDVYGNNEAPSYQTLYDDLGAYGQWVEDPQYGNVWVPNAEPGFRPYYSGGHWVMTEYGNTWVSDYPWGWAAFHYGRWTYNPYYGWVWIPGNVWGPAWVGWRYGGGYYGWAPLGPGFEFGSDFGDYNCPDDWWIFIPPVYLYSPHYYRYWDGPRENETIIHHTDFIHNTYNNRSVTYVTGPRPNEYQRVTGQSVQVYHLANSSSRTNTAVHGNELRIYHPMQIQQTTANGGHPEPTNVIKAPQGIGRPQGTGVAPAAPAFRNEVRTGNVVHVQQPIQQENQLPVAPQHKDVTPRHQIQTDEHYTPNEQVQTPPQNVNHGQQRTEQAQQQNFQRPQQAPTQSQQWQTQHSSPPPAQQQRIQPPSRPSEPAQAPRNESPGRR
jgi:hypothetical protein